ncbi:MAG: hypothetical protein ACLFTK_05615 [Anaerolineales bacterium]
MSGERPSRWNIKVDEVNATMTDVFSGGACNIRDENGALLRNRERDMINEWLQSLGVRFFDPQIHPDTHGEEYHYPKHSVVEMRAREAAQVNLYEISPRTFGGITSFEVAIDSFIAKEPTVIYYSDGDPSQDTLPPYSKDGHPLFKPLGIPDNPDARPAHYKEFIKNANNMRKYVLRFAEQMDALTVTFGEKSYEGDIVITPARMHAADMFQGIVHAARGHRVVINFTGGDTAQDKYGNPVMIVPQDLPEMHKRALLDQYIDEGNTLRRLIASMMEVSVFTRIVYTQQAAINALEELLRIKEIIKVSPSN